jgi:NADH-dependent peroxiredoxin subunit F
VQKGIVLVKNANYEPNFRMARSGVMLDTIIIGGGPAALAAAVYAARQKIKFIVISKDVGGQVAWSSDVENYLGFSSIVGIKLAGEFKKHVETNGVKVEMAEVVGIEKKGKQFIVKTPTKNYETKTVLITSGKKPRKLGVKGEEDYEKRGVAYCATCDGPVFSGMNVAVIGGGNSALDAALLLDKYAKKIYVVNLNNQLSGERMLLSKVKKSKKVHIYDNAITKEIKGDGKKVTSLSFEQNGKEFEIKVGGVFVEIGSVPSNSFDKLTKKNQWGEITIHTKNGISNQTSVTGMFAAGDVSSVPEKQVIVAAGEGVKAILGIFKYLNGLK